MLQQYIITTEEVLFIYLNLLDDTGVLCSSRSSFPTAADRRSNAGKGVCVCSYLNIKQIEALEATAAEVGKKHQLRAFDRRTGIVAREAAGPLALGPLQG